VNRPDTGRPGTDARPVAGRHSLVVLCLLGLGLGLLGGLALRQLQGGEGPTLGIADAIIRIWTNAFRLIVPFLVISQLYVALATRRAAPRDAARLGVLVPSVFVGLWAFIAAGTVVVMRGLISLPFLSGLTLTGAAPGGAGDAGTGASTESAAGAVGWVDGVIPPDLLLPSSGNALLGLLLFTVFFSLAARRLAPELQRVLELGSTAVRDTMFVLVDWLIRIAPVALFAVGLRWSNESLVIGGILLTFLVVEASLLLLATGSLYAVAGLGGRCSPARFARAMVPAQLTAFTTRSSLATVPALLAASDRELKVPSAISSVVIPLAGATLKLSQAVVYSARVVFLAHAVGVPLSIQQVVVFLLIVFPLAIATTGVPRVMGGERSAPAYVSIGIPAHFVILLGTLTPITDALETVLNSTGYMTANLLVARFAPGKAASHATPSHATPQAAPGPASALTGPASTADSTRG
jgi:Na+/H+-dicarboxylate symporter